MHPQVTRLIFLTKYVNPPPPFFTNRMTSPTSYYKIPFHFYKYEVSDLGRWRHEFQLAFLVERKNLEPIFSLSSSDRVPKLWPLNGWIWDACLSIVVWIWYLLKNPAIMIRSSIGMMYSGSLWFCFWFCFCLGEHVWFYFRIIVNTF